MNNTTFPQLVCRCDAGVFHGGMNLIYIYHVDVLALFVLIAQKVVRDSF